MFSDGLVNENTSIQCFLKVFDLHINFTPNNFRRPSGGVYSEINIKRDMFRAHSPPQAENFSVFQHSFQFFAVLRSKVEKIFDRSQKFIYRCQFLGHTKSLTKWLKICSTFFIRVRSHTQSYRIALKF